MSEVPAFETESTDTHLQVEPSNSVLNSSLSGTPTPADGVSRGVSGLPVPPPVYAVSANHDVRVDRLGEELAVDSGVWLTYVNTAAMHDAEMVDGWNKSLDVILIFASLFSAVVTAFVIESSHFLQPDYNQINALLMAHVLAGFANTENASYLSTIPSPDQILTFQKPATTEAVNVLWFAALGFSLASVLVAMLAKQWLAAYASEQPSEPHRAACERQRRFDGLHKWSLPHIMALLPALLHVSLFLFLIGLIIYMWQLDSKVSALTCVILGAIFILYFASGALSIFNSSCPYITPLSQFIRSFLKINIAPNSNHLNDRLVSRAMMWLASAKDPKTVSSALQALAGLRRRFIAYDVDQAEYLAKLALERLRGCFIPEWRHGGTYCLRTEAQYEASCYARTLMNFVDDSRCGPRTFEAISKDLALPIFLQLLGNCSNPSMAILALCDNQRLIHRTELMRWMAVRGPDGSHDKDQAGKFVRRGPARDNMTKIVRVLSDYIKGDLFLQPFAVEIAVETMGLAPLSWVTAVSANESPLSETLIPIMRLQHATRDGSLAIRRAIASTLAIFAGVHSVARNADADIDFANRFEAALSTITYIENRSESEETAREILLLGLSQFVGSSSRGGEELPIDMICEALFHEADRRTGDEDLSFSDTAAVSAMLPLLLVLSLKQEHKVEVLIRLQANAVSAAPGHNLPENSFLFHITPRDPFPANTVPILLSTLEANKNLTSTWLRDVSILLYLVTRESKHRCRLLTSIPLVIVLIHDGISEEMSNYLFWILSDAIRQAASVSDSEMLLLAASSGILNMLYDYQQMYGLTPLDIHTWVEILPVLPIVPPEFMGRHDLMDSMYSEMENQHSQRLEWLEELRKPLMQFSGKELPEYSKVSALWALQDLKNSYKVSAAKCMEEGFTYPPHTLLPMHEH